MTVSAWIILSCVNMFLMVLCTWWAVKSAQIPEINLLWIIIGMFFAWAPVFNTIACLACVLYILFDIAPNIRWRFK